MKSQTGIARVVSLDEKSNDVADGPWSGDQLSLAGATTESVQPIDVTERCDHVRSNLYSRSLDCDSHAKATTVSQIDKGYSVGTLGQRTVDDTDIPQSRSCKEPDPLDSIHQEYYVHPKLFSVKERRMSSLSMGSARASRRDRYLRADEQYEMLKLHHLNLLNEIHETALMLNLFEQRQLIREQQHKMRQIKNLQLVNNSELNRYQQNQENQQPLGILTISDDSEQVLNCGNVNINSTTNKRCMEETNAANKRQK